MNGGPRARFITLEGGEGAGKSVQAKRLEARLKAIGIEALRTREPGGSPHAEELRNAILSGFARDFGPQGEALLFAAARIDHLDVTILPALARGAWVVCDRFADSTRAYQGVAGKLSAAYIARLEQVTIGDHRPDLTLVLDIPPEIGLARAGARRGAGGADRFEAEGLAFHETLRRAFLEIAAAERIRCAVIDALKPEDEVEASIWAVVKDHLDPEGAAKANLQ
jgi:dTMP kinase